MATIKTKGIVLARSNMGDNDQMVTILTPDLGKIGAAARGSRRPKSALMAGTQFLCFADLVLYKGVSSYTLNSCEPIEIFYNIRLDVDKLTIASEIAKITNDVTDENEYSYNILQLVLNTLYMISETEKDLDFILSIFKLRLLSLIGFRPEIEKCATCGAKEEISESTVKAIKWIIWADPKKIFQFDLSEDNKQQLKILTKIYLNNCIEKEYK